MPEITVTETQRERLDEIRSDLSAAYIDTYGHIRTTDVVQYLLDTYTPPEEQDSDVAYERIATAEFPLLQRVAADVEEVPGSGIDTETMRGELLSTLGAETFAARLAELESEDTEVDTESTDSDGETVEAGGESPDDPSATTDGSAADDDTDDSSADGASDDDDDAADDDNEAGDDESSSTPDGPGSILSAANQLLTDHEDKWREGSGDEPYEVDLPDGTTKKVRTKDDIRQILFKHY